MYPYIEVPSGAVNGVNRDFRVSTDFRSGTVRVFLNGLKGQRALVDGWKEMGPRWIRLNEAPEVTDVLEIWYFPIL